MSQKCLRVAFIGAGAINFGEVGWPWDHASRLEKIGGVEVRFSCMYPVGLLHSKEIALKGLEYHC